MKQKIVIEVPMYQERYKSKAMQAAVAMDGVSSVSIESETNKMVVIGDGVDPVRLTASLRKKFDYANIIIVEEVKPPQPAEEAKKTVESQSDAVIQWQPCYDGYSYQYPQNYLCHGVSDAGSSNCSIM